ncbi:alpha-1,2-fucosyltransferase [Flavobacterium magnum]|uniref:Alpha-1,2-fucosyltransferase n=1 Tax=Flavobacterium magnum TaxID=2162713 RepID=A0A2S0REQ3_9FLAO|nr:alpha-1,2-fucosyltransferase [Flavobacterium magnum]AWA29770.1 alpha-1,2-fucosyltransferase [Flavobacterium magnum]
MIVVKLIGGLGNQMFQYAAAKAIAIERNQPLELDVSAFDHYKLHQFALHHFNFSAKVFRPRHILWDKVRSLFIKILHYKERDFGFNARIFDLKADDLYLDGYFQSEKYFLKHSSTIRREFEIISSLKPQTLKVLEEIRNTNSVSLHIRRGDYVGNPLHGTDNELFYRKALGFIETKIENPKLFVFSDDTLWAKQNFKSKHEVIFIDFNDALSNFEDIKLMSCCKHNIIANSSFSWWGAWLNDNPGKLVVAPQQWFNDKSINTSDLIPENWIRF